MDRQWLDPALEDWVSVLRMYARRICALVWDGVRTRIRVRVRIRV